MTDTRRPRYDVSKMRDDMAMKGLLPTHIARKSKLSDQSISRFFRGEAQSAPTAKKIAKAIGFSLRRYLIRSADPSTQESPREVSPSQSTHESSVSPVGGR